MRRRDVPHASGRLTSFSVEGREVAGVSIVDAGCLSLMRAVCVCGRHFNRVA